MSGLLFPGADLPADDDDVYRRDPLDGPDLEPRPLTNGTTFSAAAADGLDRSTQRGRVYEALEQRGPVGATQEELEHLTGLGGNSLRPRLVELRGRKRDEPLPELIFALPDGYARATASGKLATVYVTGGHHEEALKQWPVGSLMRRAKEVCDEWDFNDEASELADALRLRWRALEESDRNAIRDILGGAA